MKQIILLGLSGPFVPQLLAEIVQLAAAKQMQVQHASNRHDGNLHIYTGTPDDIKAAIAESGGSCVGIHMSEADMNAQPPEVTGDMLEVVKLLKHIDENSTIHLGEFRAFVEYEKADDAPKPRKRKTTEAPKEKKEGAAGDEGTGSNEQPQTPPAGEEPSQPTPPAVGDTPAASEGTEG